MNDRKCDQLLPVIEKKKKILFLICIGPRTSLFGMILYHGDTVSGASGATENPSVKSQLPTTKVGHWEISRFP